MSTTPNLQIPLVAQSQNAKEISFNTAIDMLDEALCSPKSESITGNFTVALADFQQSFFQKYSGTLTGNATITLPTGIAKMFLAVNGTSGGHNLTFQVGTNSETVTISDGNAHLLYTDGVGNVLKVS